MKQILPHFLLVFLCGNLYANTVMISTKDAQKDINHLVSKFESIHYNPYFTCSKACFNQKKETYTSTWTTDSIPLKEFMVTGMKLSALLSGGHSYMNWYNAQIKPALKAHFYIPFSGKLTDNYSRFEVTSSNLNELAVGSTITTINKHSIIDLYETCMTFIGGIKAFKNGSCEKVFPLYLFFVDKLQPPYSITTNKNETINTEGLGWINFLKFINQNNSSENYTFEIIDNNIGLLTYNSCTGYKQFRKFLKKTFAKIKKENIRKLIIDIRENGGGNSELNDVLLSYLTSTPYQQSSGRYWKVSQEAKDAYAANSVYEDVFGKEFMETYMQTPNGTIIPSFEEALTYPEKSQNYFDGKTCFLIGPNTFSSANFLADAVKTYKISTLIGQPTGEYTNDFGEQIKFKLPSSNSLVFISSTYDIGANGDSSTLAPVTPDIETGEDALDFAIRWIKKS